jgi:nitronate monooxygenase
MLSPNPLCNLLDIRYPIIQAGMAGQTTPELVAAVSNAGGLGILGATRMTPEQLLIATKKIKTITTKPYGVNLWLESLERNNQNTVHVQQFLDQKFRTPLGIPLKSISRRVGNNNEHGGTNDLPPPSKMSEQLQIILEENVPIVSFAMGDPVKYIDQIHSKGAKVMSMVTTVEDAISVVRNGSDIVMAQGAEAGGHRSIFNTALDDENIPLIGTMALVPPIVDALKKEIKDKLVPVVAGGGIVDGRGLLAALALGASGVGIGTRFLVCHESGAFQGYKERLLSTNETDTVVTKVFTGRSARVLRNTFVDEYAKSDLKPLPWPLQGFVTDDIYSNAKTKNNAEFYPLYSGQGLRMLKRDQSAEEVVKELMSEAKEYLTILDKEFELD